MPRDGSGIYSRPPGTNAVPDTTIESTKYNNFVGDVETDLNAPRPIIAGGTGGTSPAAARANLKAEVATTQVTNYDSHTFEAGSFFSNDGATGGPGGTVGFYSGVCHMRDANNLVLEVMQYGFLPADTPKFFRVKNGGTWGAWLSGLAQGDGRYVNVTGDTMTGSLTTNALYSPNLVMAGTTTIGNHIASDGTNTYARTNGFFTIDNSDGSTNLAKVDSSGSLTLNGNLQVKGGVVLLLAQSALSRSGNYTSIHDAAAVTKIRIGNNTDATTIYSNETHSFYNSNTTTQIANFVGGGMNVFVGSGYKPGGGAWGDNSDARIKTVLGDYEHGLDEVLALSPKRFTYKGNDTPEPPVNTLKTINGVEDKSTPVVPYANSAHREAATTGQEFIGLIAQEAEVPMPELVSTREGYIDGTHVTDLRTLESSALVYALVNAVKTLNERLAALEAAASVPVR